MAEPKEEILKILDDIEDNTIIPSGTLKQIYELEYKHVHSIKRTELHEKLHRIISDAAGKVK